MSITEIILEKFEIATPPDGEKINVFGRIVDGFGIHGSTISFSEAVLETSLFYITHLGTGWRIFEAQGFSKAKGICKILNENDDWDLVETSGNKLKYMPNSCKGQVLYLKKNG